MPKLKNRKLILIELNEINFDIVKEYLALDNRLFPNMRRLVSSGGIRTKSEIEYQNLEPWIQWASVHTCKAYAEHQIFRLGDIVGSSVPQIFEELEQAGYAVGAISAMNAENRLKQPAYFIPDPWTQTPSDSSWWSQSLGKAVSQTVNDNAQAHITLKSAIYILFGLLRFAQVKHYRKFLSLILGSRRKPWFKALVLDLFLHDVHWSMFNKKRPNFSTLFLNAGAHIQHHYFFNAKPFRVASKNMNPAWYVSQNEDPVADVLSLYDMIIGEYFEQTDIEVILATGLSQKPYDRIKFYYRLNAHEEFLRRLGIAFSAVYPRMTRDFLLEFSDEQLAQVAHDVLANVIVGGSDARLFGEIDNRGKSLFVTLTYPHEITSTTTYRFGNQEQQLLPEVSFVAIKNGMHQDQGFAFFSRGFAAYAPSDLSHCSQIGSSIKKYFDVPA